AARLGVEQSGRPAPRRRRPRRGRGVLDRVRLEAHPVRHRLGRPLAQRRLERPPHRPRPARPPHAARPRRRRGARPGRRHHAGGHPQPARRPRHPRGRRRRRPGRRAGDPRVLGHHARRLRLVRLRRRRPRQRRRLPARLARTGRGHAGQARPRRRGALRAPPLDIFVGTAARRRDAGPVPLLARRVARRAGPGHRRRHGAVRRGRHRDGAAVGADAQHAVAGRRRSPGARRAGAARPGDVLPGRRRALRRRDGRGGPHRLRGADGPPRRPGHLRSRLPVDPPVVARARADAAARRRHARPGRRPARRARGRRHHRLRRRPVLHRPGPPPEARQPLMDATIDAPAAPPPTDRPTARATGVTRAPDGSLVVRVRRGRLSARLDARSVAVTAVALGLATLVFAWSLTLGDYPLSLGDVVRTLVGQGEQRHEFIVRTLRLPRGLTGLLVGASLGLAGAVFQRIMRNPLASPDLIGISNGAAAAAVFVIVVLGGSSTEVTWGALAGAVGTGAAIHLLAYKRGISGYRLVLVGVAVTAMMTSITSYLLTRAEIYEAQRAVVWLTGSLNARGWDHVRPLTVALAVLLPAVLALARHL